MTTKHARRHVVAARDGWDCRYCKRTTVCFTCLPPGPDVRESLLEATLDHILPRALGGTRGYHNQCIACQPCNTRKGTQSFWTFRATVEEGAACPNQ